MMEIVVDDEVLGGVCEIQDMVEIVVDDLKFHRLKVMCWFFDKRNQHVFVGNSIVNWFLANKSKIWAKY
jgi:hypothetical protein